MRRHVTMVTKFLDYNQREFSQQQKSNRFSFVTEQLCTSRFFVYFLALVARLRHENFLISLARSVEQGGHSTKIFFFFFLSDSTQKFSPTFDKLNEVK